MRSVLGLVLAVGCACGVWAEEAPTGASDTAQPLDIAALGAQHLARVGDREISALEFQREMEFQLRVAQLSGVEPPAVDREFRMRAMASLVDRVLLQLMAENAGIRVSDAEVDTEYGKRKRLFLGEHAFETYLTRLGYTDASLREELRRGLLAERFVASKTDGIAADPNAVLLEYQRLRQAGKMARTERTADLRQILIRASDTVPESWADAESRIKAARERVLSGESFDSVARSVSEDFVSVDEGGRYTEATPQMVLPEFAARLFTQKPGEVSEPFKSRMGWHLLVIEQVNEPGTVSFEKTKAGLERMQAAPLRQKAIGDLLAQARAIYRVELYPAGDPKP